MSELAAGVVVGALTVTKKAGSDIHGRMLWECQCSCGATTVVSSNKLRAGRTRTCGHCKTGTWQEVDTYTDTRDSMLQAYKEARAQGKFAGHPRIELLYLEQAMDRGGYTSKEWSWLYGRWKKVHGRVYKPSARYQVRGAVGGRAPQADERRIEAVQCIEDIKEVLAE